MIECNSYLDLLTAIKPGEHTVVRLVERTFEDQRWHACPSCYLDSMESSPNDTPWVGFKILLVPGYTADLPAKPGLASCYLCHCHIWFP